MIDRTSGSDGPQGTLGDQMRGRTGHRGSPPSADGWSGLPPELDTAQEERNGNVGSVGSQGMEADLELPLLRAELRTALDKLCRERRRAEQVQSEITAMNLHYQAEKEKERDRVERQRAVLHEARQRLEEMQRRVQALPECGKEQLREKLQEEAEAVDGALRAFEDVEFQALERLSGLEEEREAQSQRLVLEQLQCQRRVSSREERVWCLEQMVGRAREQLSDAGQYLEPEANAVQSLGQSSRMARTPPRELGAQGDPTLSVFTTASLSVTQGVLKDPVLYRSLTGSFRRKRRELSGIPGSERPESMQAEGLSLPPLHLLSLITLQRSKSFGTPHQTMSVSHSNQLPTIPGSPEERDPAAETSPRRRAGHTRCSRATSFHEGSLSLLVEMERKLRAAMAEKERLLRARDQERGGTEEGDLTADGAPSTAGPGQRQQTQRVHWAPPPAAPFDLRSHVESAGHGVGTCPHLELTSTTCRGSLTKVGRRIRTWRKRWFVFDSRQGRLSYYTDQRETKRKGVIYFQAIEEVYFDHLRSAPKSPNPLLTFCLKTYDRLYYLVAPSDVALRIWMEVILTAVEGTGRF
ncbi:pleckstrin homology-like domain family B member 1 [Pristis pectinata]|uniref:pleckstrin homology-like domain family B member 1 n=1 Tax=Pristis pectinata TaxID=685728 RepID=UPI00223D354E|nr:pleckstrin homology-like domain family B member 1 [Pristis pectinata]